MANDDKAIDTSLIDEFIDDYFAECDEHLAAVRTSLLVLESTVGRPVHGTAAVDSLLRAFHSIKGLSGMVGIEAAERIAHDVETALRPLRQESVILDSELLATLASATNMLERVIAARRTHDDPPDITPVLARLASAPAPVASTAGERQRVTTLGPDEQVRLDAALAAGARAWLFTFEPSTELAERGVSVNHVRSLLDKVGDVVHVTPQVIGGGRVAFQFLVASQADESTFAEWQPGGVSWAPASEMGQRAPLPGHTPDVAHPALAPASMVRVDLARLDEVMERVGDLVITRLRLADQLAIIEPRLPQRARRPLQEIGTLLERQLRDLRSAAMRVRLIPMGEIFTRMQFVVHDLLRSSGKQVRLDVSGQETEIDKLVVDRMLDPLLHLVRNAVSHGLETPQERVASGKSPEGTLMLHAATAGDTIIIRVQDDGRGIDIDAVAARGRELGLLGDTGLDPDHLLDLLCAPGFSTRHEADLASGRGVGLSAVRKTVQELAGSLELETTPGQGSCFTIQLPMTLAILDAVIVSAGGQTFAIPQLALREIVDLPEEVPQLASGPYLMQFRGGALPILPLADLLGLSAGHERTAYVLVTGQGGQAAGIGVDHVRGLREIVVRPATDPLIQVPGIAGATELGDGRPVLILDPTALIHARHEAKEGPRYA